MKIVGICPKCKGQLVKNYDDVFCFLCSWRPKPENLPTETATIDKTYPGLSPIYRPNTNGMTQMERGRIIEQWVYENSEVMTEYTEALGKTRAQAQLGISNRIWNDFLERQGMKESRKSFAGTAVL